MEIKRITDETKLWRTRGIRQCIINKENDDEKRKKKHNTRLWRMRGIGQCIIIMENEDE